MGWPGMHSVGVSAGDKTVDLEHHCQLIQMMGYICTKKMFHVYLSKLCCGLYIDGITEQNM